ncbi:MAG: sprT domain-containing protein [Cytophagales bacterium]|nr:MAG: sprT domain-containing protein [Cytophagales bacterium]
MTDPFDKHLPPAAVPYARQLWQQYKFRFVVSRPRRTRLGDFRALPDGSLHITVNADLNPYAFLLTYVHEVAHAAVHRHTQTLKRRARPKPHGPLWQQTFANLMAPLLTEAVYPPAILEPLRDYMRRPAASSYAHPALMQALREADQRPTGQTQLRDIPEGQAFIFAKKTFVRGTFRRTRIVCKEVESGRSYTILAHALVEIDRI